MVLDPNLMIPVYVDTSALLDLLASIEGGFSLVEKVTSRTATTAGSDKSLAAEVGTEFGVPNVLSLLRIRLGGSLRSAKQRESAELTETDRYHTYGSLLHRLRGYLEQHMLIRRPGADDTGLASVGPSDFVEVRGLFRPNPLVDSLERIDRLISLMELMSGFETRQPGKPSGGQKAPQDEKKHMRQMRQFMQGVLTDIEKKNTRFFVLDSGGQDPLSAVVLLFIDYLRDQTMAEVAHREYRLLGKVVRKVEDQNGSIDLLRGTGLGGVGRELLDQFLAAFNQAEGMNLPQVKTEILGPALEIVPIAIYV